MQRKRVIGMGEILWDMLPQGRRLGGAPANFTYHAQALGADARVVSRIGSDALGEEITARFDQLGLAREGLQIDTTHPTGTVSVTLASDGQPRFTIHEEVAWDHLEATPSARAAAGQADAIAFGTLAQRSETSGRTIRELAGAAPPSTLRVLDVNLRPPFYNKEIIATSLALANVVKLNEVELPILSDLFGWRGSVEDQLARLQEQFALQVIVFTRGAHGSLLRADGRWSRHPGLPVKVQDTIGAGDAFTAAVTLGLLAGWALDEINERAARVGAYVCGCEGATPDLPASLRNLFTSNST